MPHHAFILFQAMFAGITVALISGAVVERMKSPAFLLFAALWTTVIYDPLAHWVWGSGGWLAELGALDFAGGTVIHISAGTAAVVAALMLGPRRDFRRAALVPHNVPLTLLGAQLIAVVATIIFVGVGTAGVVGLVQVLVGIRVPLNAEIEGIDIGQHGEEAYFGGGLASLKGAGIGDSVVLPAGEGVPRASGRDPTPEPA